MPIYPGTTLTAKFLGATVTAGPVFAPAGTEMTPIVYGSGTMAIDYSLSAKELIQSGTATWVSAGFGTFTATGSAIKVYGDCWIRMRCTAGEVGLSVNPAGNTIPMRSDPTTEGAGGGGGSTTFAGLTDKATADIPAINGPVATALAEKASTASLGSAAFTNSTAYATAAQGATADAALQPGLNLTQAKVTGATASGVQALLMYQGTWAGRPGSPADGDFASFTDFGRDSLWRYSSTAGGWLPIGWQTLGSLSASFATGLSTVSGVTAGAFSSQIVVPAGLLLPGMRISVRSIGQRTGATATATLNIRLGTSASTADAQLNAPSLGATTALLWNTDVLAWVNSSTSITSIGGVVSNSTGASGTAGDKTTNINTASAMTLTADISAANVADSFKLALLSLEVAY